MIKSITEIQKLADRSHVLQRELLYFINRYRKHAPLKYRSGVVFDSRRYSIMRRGRSFSYTDIERAQLDVIPYYLEKCGRDIAYTQDSQRLQYPALDPDTKSVAIDVRCYEPVDVPCLDLLFSLIFFPELLKIKSRLTEDLAIATRSDGREVYAHTACDRVPQLIDQGTCSNCLDTSHADFIKVLRTA